MTDRELMQQTLDLLDDINQCSFPPTGIPLPAEIDHAIEALRARLAQPEKEWVWLTDEEIRKGNKNSWVTREAWESAVWWAESKLKEKNI